MIHIIGALSEKKKKKKKKKKDKEKKDNNGRIIKNSCITD